MKNLLLFSALLLTSAGALAQLTVKPTTGAASKDSFIYVKDQILYVDGYVNLETNNPTGNQVTSIYLRDNGQLIQGGAGDSNTGNGFLSVQQNTKPTNAFAYYYWASPVGNPTIEPNTGNTNFGLGSIYEDDNLVKGVGTKAVLSGNITTKEGYSSPLTISRRWMYIHPLPKTEAEDAYDRINASNGAPPGFGFTMKGVNEGTAGVNTANTTLDQIYEFRGRPNSGTFTIPVDGPIHVGPDARVDAKMTLTGNPYPSALDLNKVFYELGNEALSAIYYYDENRAVMSHFYNAKPFGYGAWTPGPRDPYFGDVPNYPAYKGNYVRASFSIWNAGGGSGPDPAGGYGGDDKNKRFAPIGQGFMFVGKELGTAKIMNSHRVFIKEGAPGSVFQRPSGDNTNEGDSANEDDRNISITNIPTEDTRTPQLRLYVVFDNALTRDMLLILSDETTDGYDRGYDGLSPGGMKNDVFFPIITNNEKLPYVIQGTNYNVDKQIPITLTLDKSSLVSVRAVEEINVPYQKAYLFDNIENTYTQLHTGNISMGITLPAGIYEDRFYIVFRNLNLRSDVPQEEMLAKEAVRKSVNFFQNNPAQQLEVKNPDAYTFKSAAVYDMAGKLVINEKNLGDDTKYNFYTGNLSDGVYLIKLTTSEDIIIDHKAIVHNK